MKHEINIFTMLCIYFAVMYVGVLYRLQYSDAVFRQSDERWPADGHMKVHEGWGKSSHSASQFFLIFSDSNRTIVY